MTEFSNTQLAADPILRYFSYSHLPMSLQAVSGAFCALAASVIESVPRNAERTVALRKLLEAKDAAVRANVPEPKPQTFYDRLLAEGKELEGRIDKLADFMNGPDYRRLPEKQRALLADQITVMRGYRNILQERIADIATGQGQLAPAGEAIDENVRVTGGGHSETPIPFRDDGRFGGTERDSNPLDDPLGLKRD